MVCLTDRLLKFLSYSRPLSPLGFTSLRNISVLSKDSFMMPKTTLIFEKKIMCQLKRFRDVFNPVICHWLSILNWLICGLTLTIIANATDKRINVVFAFPLVYFWIWTKSIFYDLHNASSFISHLLRETRKRLDRNSATHP